MTSRILIVDMLNGLIPWKKLGGIIFYMTSGQLIKENCTENFILRYYAQQVYNANLAHEQVSARGLTDTSSLATGTEAFDGYNDPSKAAAVSDDVSRKLCIKAFTESPSAFAHGWNTLEKVAKALKVGTKVYIWPRFRRAVNECIQARQPESVQLHVDLAPIQSQIHQHLVTIFKLCLEDLRRRCSAHPSTSSSFSPTAAVSTPIASSSSSPLRETDISYDNALFSNFYSGIQAILEPLGSRVPRKIRSLLHDLNLLRDLLRTLIRCDAVTFYEKFHKMLRDQSTGDSNASLDWLHLKEADTVASLSQERLWRTPTFRSPFSDAAHSTSGRMTAEERQDPPPLTLEDNPKWRALLSVIQEIETENQNLDLGLGSQPIVILVRDEEARAALSEYILLSNPLHYLLYKLKRHVLFKVESYNASKASRAKASRVQNFFADSRQAQQRTSRRVPTASAASSSSSSSSSSPPLPSASASSSKAPTVINVDDADGGEADEAPLDFALGSSSSGNDLELGKQRMYQALLSQVEERVQSDMNSQRVAMQLGGGDGDRGGRGGASSGGIHNDHNDFERYFGLMKGSGCSSSAGGKRKAPIVTQAWESNFSSLSSFFEDVSPHFVVLYDPDPSIVRQVECYKAGRPGWFVRLYVMIYSNSLEHDKYLATLKQEQDVFTQLVNQKAKLADEDAAMQADIVSKDLVPSSVAHSDRRGGGAPSLVLGGGILTTLMSSASSSNSTFSEQLQEELVIVDTREFRSKLPGMLHQHGITIKPQTLVIADYILSPDIAVERKSIPDLKQSFRTGHLYNQIENLTRIYAKPILLIEFDSSEPFELTSSDRLQPGKFSIHDLSSQLALLTKAFPKMRVCWSRSPAETAQLFLTLKRGKLQPNASYVSQRHLGLSPELSSHTDELATHEDVGIIDDEGSKRKTNRHSTSNRRLLAQVSGSEESASATVSSPNLAPFYPMDVLQRIPGLNKDSNWKPLLYPTPPSSSSSPQATKPSQGSPPKSPFRSASVTTSTASPSVGPSASSGTSPTKLPDNPLDGSLFELDDDEDLLDLLDAEALAPLDLGETRKLAAPPARGTSASSPSQSPNRDDAPLQPIKSLAALAVLPKDVLVARLGSKIGAEIHNFMHRTSDRSSLSHVLGEADGRSRGRGTRGSEAATGRGSWRGQRAKRSGR